MIITEKNDPLLGRELGDSGRVGKTISEAFRIHGRTTAAEDFVHQLSRCLDLLPPEEIWSLMLEMIDQFVPETQRRCYMLKEILSSKDDLSDTIEDSLTYFELGKNVARAAESHRGYGGLLSVSVCRVVWSIIECKASHEGECTNDVGLPVIQRFEELLDSKVASRS